MDMNIKAGKDLKVYINNCCFVFRWCPPGKIVLSRRQEKEYIRKVYSPEIIFTKGFWFGETPITLIQWENIMGYNLPNFGYTNDCFDFPISEINVKLAHDYISTLNEITYKNDVLNNQKFYIPNIGQWEYACRAHTNTKWFFGDDDSDLKHYAWYRCNSGDTKHPVRLLKPNAWGIYDLYGNVMEICYDLLPTDYTSAPKQLIDPLSNSQLEQVMYTRGGSYDDDIDDCLPARGRIVGIDNSFNEPVGLRLILL